MTEYTKPLPSEYRIPEENLNPEPQYYKAEMLTTLNLLLAKCLTKSGVLKRCCFWVGSGKSVTQQVP
jgi:hypothetical protein